MEYPCFYAPASRIWKTLPSPQNIYAFFIERACKVLFRPKRFLRQLFFVCFQVSFSDKSIIQGAIKRCKTSDLQRGRKKDTIDRRNRSATLSQQKGSSKLNFFPFLTFHLLLQRENFTFWLRTEDAWPNDTSTFATEWFWYFFQSIFWFDYLTLHTSLYYILNLLKHSITLWCIFSK